MMELKMFDKNVIQESSFEDIYFQFMKDYEIVPNFVQSMFISGEEIDIDYVNVNIESLLNKSVYITHMLYVMDKYLQTDLIKETDWKLFNHNNFPFFTFDIGQDQNKSMWLKFYNILQKVKLPKNIYVYIPSNYTLGFFLTISKVQLPFYETQLKQVNDIMFPLSHNQNIITTEKNYQDNFKFISRWVKQQTFNPYIIVQLSQLYDINTNKQLQLNSEGKIIGYFKPDNDVLTIDFRQNEDDEEYIQKLKKLYQQQFNDNKVEIKTFTLRTYVDDQRIKNDMKFVFIPQIHINWNNVDLEQVDKFYSFVIDEVERLISKKNIQSENLQKYTFDEQEDILSNKNWINNNLQLFINKKLQVLIDEGLFTISSILQNEVRQKLNRIDFEEDDFGIKINELSQDYLISFLIKSYVYKIFEGVRQRKRQLIEIYNLFSNLRKLPLEVKESIKENKQKVFTEEEQQEIKYLLEIPDNQFVTQVFGQTLQRMMEYQNTHFLNSQEDIKEKSGKIQQLQEIIQDSQLIGYEPLQQELIDRIGKIWKDIPQNMIRQFYEEVPYQFIVFSILYPLFLQESPQEEIQKQLLESQQMNKSPLLVKERYIKHQIPQSMWDIPQEQKGQCIINQFQGIKRQYPVKQGIDIQTVGQSPYEQYQHPQIDFQIQRPKNQYVYVNIQQQNIKSDKKLLQYIDYDQEIPEDVRKLVDQVRNNEGDLNFPQQQVEQVLESDIPEVILNQMDNIQEQQTSDDTNNPQLNYQVKMMQEQVNDQNEQRQKQLEQLQSEGFIEPKQQDELINDNLEIQQETSLRTPLDQSEILSQLFEQGIGQDEVLNQLSEQNVGQNEVLNQLFEQKKEQDIDIVNNIENLKKDQIKQNNLQQDNIQQLQKQLKINKILPKEKERDFVKEQMKEQNLKGKLPQVLVQPVNTKEVKDKIKEQQKKEQEKQGQTGINGKIPQKVSEKIQPQLEQMRPTLNSSKEQVQSMNVQQNNNQISNQQKQQLQQNIQPISFSIDKTQRQNNKQNKQKFTVDSGSKISVGEYTQDLQTGVIGKISYGDQFKFKFQEIKIQGQFPKKSLSFWNQRCLQILVSKRLIKDMIKLYLGMYYTTLQSCPPVFCTDQNGNVQCRVENLSITSKVETDLCQGIQQLYLNDLLTSLKEQQLDSVYDMLTDSDSFNEVINTVIEEEVQDQIQDTVTDTLKNNIVYDPQKDQFVIYEGDEQEFQKMIIQQTIQQQKQRQNQSGSPTDKQIQKIQSILPPMVGVLTKQIQKMRQMKQKSGGQQSGGMYFVSDVWVLFMKIIEFGNKKEIQQPQQQNNQQQQEQQNTQSKSEECQLQECINDLLEQFDKYVQNKINTDENEKKTLEELENEVKEKVKGQNILKPYLIDDFSKFIQQLLLYLEKHGIIQSQYRFVQIQTPFDLVNGFGIKKKFHWIQDCNQENNEKVFQIGTFLELMENLQIGQGIENSGDFLNWDKWKVFFGIEFRF